MDMDERNEIVQLRTFCQDLGAHVREVQDGASFTAMLWEDADSMSENAAAEIQRLSLIHILRHGGHHVCSLLFSVPVLIL